MIDPIPKPNNWDTLPLYQKIQVYAQHLTREHAVYVDKLKAKKIVKEKLGDNIKVAKVVRVFDNWKSFNQEDLNPNHILKAAHASGWNLNIVPTTTVADARYHLSMWRGLFSANKEKQYSYLTPCSFIEEKLEDAVVGERGNCLVYMFRYIHGELISLGVGYNINKQQKMNHYDVQWNLVLPPELSFDVPRPKRLGDMLKMSKTLAEDFEFVRIDFFYDKYDDIYFGEYTFTPKAGKPVFPEALEIEYGQLWI